MIIGGRALMHEDALTSIVPAEALGDVGKVGATDL